MFALPQAADDFVRALSSFKNRASAAKAATNAAADTASNRGLSSGSSTLGTPTSVPTGGAAAASASKGTSGATSAVPTSQGIAQSARNTVQHLREKYKGLLQHLSESDLKGAAREVKGCLKGNHRQEVTEALTGVEGQIVRLERLLTQEYWTRDPIRLANIHDELQFLYSVRSRAMSALRGRHKVHG